jgi:hypothetical protein
MKEKKNFLLFLVFEKTKKQTKTKAKKMKYHPLEKPHNYDFIEPFYIIEL